MKPRSMDSEPPVKEGQEIVLDIQSIGGKGDGIGRVRGFIIFVPGVSKGDRVKVRISKVTQNVAFADVIERLERPAEPIKTDVNIEDFKPKKKEEKELDLHEELDSEDFGEEE